MGDRAMIAIMLGSLVLIFGSALILQPSAANAFGANAGKQAMLEEEDDEKLLKLAIDMKLAEKDLEALMKNEHNRARFFDEKVTKGMIDRDLLEKLMHMQHDMLEELDKHQAEPMDEEAKHAHMHAEDPDEGDVEDNDNMDVVEPDDDAEDVEVKALDDEDLMKMALEMKLMEKEMGDFLKKGDSSRRALLFDPLISKGLIDRELLEKLSLMREDLLRHFKSE